ncbi:hypothetical protein CLV72_11510 [Allonocardiopsis opalescens]|uniref:Uncharacterized protein n=1 Tax=Allonocardiopsis opalescens TaxID=1144618 RepID=A0A2T0PPV4_9ACTN|nr:hypothetical protein CLV72_11510 [Allonocardiopsis opalescens]
MPGWARRVQGPPGGGRYPREWRAVPGLSTRAHAVLLELERVHPREPLFRADFLGQLLSSWRTLVNRPRIRHSFSEPDDPCYCEFGHDPPQWARSELEAACAALPLPVARELRALLRPLDARFRARTLPDLSVPADRPWWYRRC